MHHAITVGGLLSALCVMVGTPLVLLGILMVFAGGMSDAPDDGDRTSEIGCAVSLVAVGLILLGAWGLA